MIQKIYQLKDIFEMETILYATEMPRQLEWRDDTVLWGFYPSKKLVEMTYSEKRIIHKVKVTPYEGPEDKALYWGWWDNEREAFSMIYHSKTLVSLCFIYGPEVEETAGKGKVMPLLVTKVEE